MFRRCSPPGFLLAWGFFLGLVLWVAMLWPGRAHSTAAGAWRLTFADEFNSPTLDRQRWITTFRDGARTHLSNQEAQYYLDSAVQTQQGRLILRADRLQVAGMPYTSGMINSFGKFSQQYGYFEMRARFPGGKGFWPAFWLVPDSRRWPPEIDVVEMLGHPPNVVYFTNHYRDASGKHQRNSRKYVGPDVTQGFHVYGLLWEPQGLTWFLDGMPVFRATQGVPQEPMYMILNLAVGGDWPGYPDAQTPFPSQMEVDYVRVYARS